MPKYARRGTRRRPARRGRRTIRRRRTGLRKGIKRAVQYANGLSVMNTMPSKVHFFKRAVVNQFTIVNQIATGDITGTRIAAFNDVASYTEFLALFQKYRLCKLKYTFKYTKAATTNANHPVLYCWKNNDPDLVPGSISAAYMQQCQFVRRYQFSEENREFSISIYPYWLLRTYLGLNSSGYADMPAKRSAYLDTNYSGIPHYGLAYCIPAATGGAMELWRVEVDCEYSFMFKDVY